MKKELNEIKTTLELNHAELQLLTISIQRALEVKEYAEIKPGLESLKEKTGDAITTILDEYYNQYTPEEMKGIAETIRRICNR